MIPLGGFARHVKFGDVLILKFFDAGTADIKAAYHTSQLQRDVQCGVWVQWAIDLDSCVRLSGLRMQNLGVSLMTTPFTRHCMGHIKWLSIKRQWIAWWNTKM